MINPFNARHRWIAQQAVAAYQSDQMQAQAQVGLAHPGAVLSQSEVAYLMDRSIRFALIFSSNPTTTLNELKVSVVQGESFRMKVAAASAVALFGDDHNYVTGGPSVDFNGDKQFAAYNLVLNNLVAWYTQYGPATHPAMPPGG